MPATVQPTRQIGQPVLRIVLFVTRVGHSWLLLAEQSHQILFPEFAVISVGFSLPFLVGCHSFAKSGQTSAKELPETTLP
jgi:hypothetical protein